MSVPMLDHQVDVRRPSREELEEIASRPNGTHVLLNLVRDGLVSPAEAVDLSEGQERTRRARIKGWLKAIFRLFLPG